MPHPLPRSLLVIICAFNIAIARMRVSTSLFTHCQLNSIVGAVVVNFIAVGTTSALQHTVKFDLFAGIKLLLLGVSMAITGVVLNFYGWRVWRNSTSALPALASDETALATATRKLRKLLLLLLLTDLLLVITLPTQFANAVRYLSQSTANEKPTTSYFWGATPLYIIRVVATGLGLALYWSAPVRRRDRGRSVPAHGLGGLGPADAGAMHSNSSLHQALMMEPAPDDDMYYAALVDPYPGEDYR